MHNLSSLHRLSIGLLGILATPAILATTACGSLGDRARDGCPSGEVCNPDTPNGLRFYGSPMVGTLGTSPGPIAVGGRQLIRFEDAAQASRVLPAHQVVSSNPSVLAPPDATHAGSVVGVAEGSADLRVIDTENRLIDRLTMVVSPIASVELVAADDLVVALAELESHAPVVFGPGVERVGIGLFSASGVRLVDDAATITSAAAIGRDEWDTITGTFGTSEVPLTVHAGGASFDVVARVAGAIDDLELVTTLVTGAAEGMPIVGAGDTVCVVPRSGGARVVGGTTRVAFRVDGTAIVADEPGRCIVLPSGLGASVVVEASVGSVVRTFTFEVDPMRANAAMPLESGRWVLPRIVPHALGARARLAWGLD